MPKGVYIRKKNTSLGKDNNNWRGGKVKAKCDWCSKAIVRSKAEYNYYKSHFCNGKCKREYEIANNIPTGMTGKKQSIKAIELTMARNKEAVGEKSFNWKGGITKDMVAYRKEYKKNHKDQVANHKRLRRARKYDAGGSHTGYEWETLKAQYNWTCRMCLKTEPDIKLTEDHIIAISKGGSDNIENIQPLCRSCNAKKGTKVWKPQDWQK